MRKITAQNFEYKIKNLELRIKKTLTVLLFVILNSLFVFPAYAATLSLSPASGTFNKGCAFTVDIKVDTQGQQVDGVDAILFYDPTRFAASKVNTSTLFAEYPASTIDAQAGKITVSGLASSSAPYSGTGTMATINFTVAGAAPDGVSQVTFDFDPANPTKTTDSNVAQHGTVNDILSSVGNGSFTVGSGSGCGAQVASGSGTLGQGATSLVTPTVPLKTLSPGEKSPGTTETTLAIVLVGGVLTVIGILGLALL